MRKVVIMLLMAVLYSSAAFASYDEQPASEATTDAATHVEEVPDINPHLAPKGYRGFAEISLNTFSLNVKTTHGYQFNHYLFLGGGIGYFDTFGPEPERFLPIYISLQGNAGKKLAQFTYGIKAGVIGYHEFHYTNATGWNIHSVGGGGLYLQSCIGLRLGFNPDFALLLRPEAEIMFVGLPFIYAGLNVAFEF